MMTQASTLGRYEILQELGRGATGVVYAARDRSTGAVVALKILDPALLNKPNASFAESVLKDALSARYLKHRNIVKIHDAGEADGTAYIAMELLEGESLRKILDDGPLSIARAIRIVDEIARGLAYAHEEAGVVHRGVKPSNIIVLRSGGAKLGDFGIGQLGEAAILSGRRAGCLSCMSPEQVRGDRVDGRSDIFSLGAVFYEMLTRRPPFEGDSPNEIVENILHAELPAPSDVNPHVPRALDRIVLGMLAGHPDDRVPGARILLRDLQRLEEELGLGPDASAHIDEPAATRPPPEPEPGLRTPNPIRFRSRAPMQDGEAFDERDAMFMMDRELEPERSFGSRPAVFTALGLVLAVLAIGLAVVLHYSSGPAEPRIAASGMQQAPATAPAPSLPAAPPPVAEAPKESLDIASAPKPADTPGQPEAAGKAPSQEAPRATQPTANVPEQQTGGTATLIIAVSPQGEIYIDGKHYGTTPPITTLDLAPGMHRIEVRSRSRKPYLTYMTIQAGDVRRIRHDFAAKPSRPPT